MYMYMYNVHTVYTYCGKLGRWPEIRLEPVSKALLQLDEADAHYECIDFKSEEITI